MKGLTNATTLESQCRAKNALGMKPNLFSLKQGRMILRAEYHKVIDFVSEDMKHRFDQADLQAMATMEKLLLYTGVKVTFHHLFQMHRVQTSTRSDSGLTCRCCQTT